MKTKIPDFIERGIRDKVASGDYSPINSELGPISGSEWLALIEDEAEHNEENPSGQNEHIFAVYAGKLRAVAEELRSEGFKPIVFHWHVDKTDGEATL